MSDAIGVWNERDQCIVYSRPPQLKRNLIGQHTPFGEVPLEWLAEIEWRVARPTSWDGCWYMTTRRRPAEVRRADDQQWSFKSNPNIRVMEFIAGVGWRNKVVRARKYIAEIFFEWDGIEDPQSSYVQGFQRSDTGTRVVIEKPRSLWEVTMSCKDDRCVNPSHMRFQPASGNKD